MGIIIILPFAALACFGIVGIYRWLRRGGYGRPWWQAYCLLALAGLSLGIWFCFFLEYKVANKRVAGFPIPVAISNLQDGQWSTEILPAYVRYPAIITDLLGGIALCLAPIAVAAFFHENRARQREASPDRPS
jgi:hypothetical protein